MSFTVLYVIWGALYALTAALGFTAPEGAMVYLYQVIACVFFIPGWLILRKADAENQHSHTWVVRFLAIVWVIVTAVLLALNIRSAGWSDAAGNALNAALCIASAPLVCGQKPVISVMLWGIVLMRSMRKPGTRKERKEKT